MAGSGAGRRGGRWRRLHREQRAKRLGCWRCGQPIDYDAAWPDPNSFSVDHWPPLSLYPAGAEDPACLRSAHLDCNSSAQDKLTRPGLGNSSRDW